MKNIIKDNLPFLIVCSCIFILCTTAIFNYYGDVLKMEKENLKSYNECKENLHDKIYCYYNGTLYKQRNDTVSTFGMITSNLYKSMGYLQILAPLFIMISSSCLFHKALRKGLLKNCLLRTGYKGFIKKNYIRALGSSLILPFFLLFVFIISFIISGNFDYKYGMKVYSFTTFGVSNHEHWKIFLIVYMLNFILHGIFWINIGLYNCKYNKNVAISIILSYFEYVLFCAIFELELEKGIFSGTKYSMYFNLSNIWVYSGVTLIGMIIISLFLAVVSTIMVYLAYKNKEDVLMEIEK